MIVKGIVLIILVFAAFIFLGLKISESVGNSSIRLFFFCLYFMTIFTIFNLCLTVYFFIKLKDKRGYPGKKGLKGPIGDIGDDGSCGSGEEVRLNFIRAIEIIIKDTKLSEANKCELITVLIPILKKDPTTYTSDILKKNFNNIKTSIEEFNLAPASFNLGTYEPTILGLASAST